MLWVLRRGVLGRRGMRRESGSGWVRMLFVCTCLSTMSFLCTETLLGCLPVDDIPDGGEIFSFAVLVLKIVLKMVMLDEIQLTRSQLTACSHASTPSRGLYWPTTGSWLAYVRMPI
jgi:hypothetical protein